MTTLDGGQHYPFDLRDLPPGWAAAYVGSLVQELRPGFPSGEHNSTGQGIPHLRPMNIDREGRLDLTEIKYVSSDHPQRLAFGDVLFNNTNSPVLIGKSTAITVHGDFAYSNHMTRLRLHKGLDPKFIAFQLHFLWMTRYFRHRCVNHVNQASIGTSALGETVPLLVPPSNEQRRIVAKIEELFSDLDAGVAALVRVRANLKRYRAAVVKAAVEGRLTEEWRTRHPATEPAAKLLERILAERRAKWEQDQLRKFKEAGKTPPKGWKEKYAHPALANVAELPKLPGGWHWVTVDLATEVRDDLRQPVNADEREHRQGPYPYYGATGQVGWIDGFLMDGEYVLLGEDGAPFLDPYKHKAYLVQGRCWVNNHAHVLRAIDGVASNRFTLHALNAASYRGFANGTTRLKLTQAAMRRLPVRLPPLAEQAEIVAEVDRRLSVADAAETQVEHALQRAARLRQAILKRAFEGKLVPQDPADESATTLLKGIGGTRSVSLRSESERRRTTIAPRQSRGREGRHAGRETMRRR